MLSKTYRRRRRRRGASKREGRLRVLKPWSNRDVCWFVFCSPVGCRR
ncbi:ORF7 [Barthadenovirus mellis]|uniref:ORF7 n=1 Tax=Passerine adenovirus 1 TaxID=2779174 RepID=A0A7M4BDZ7_9ADEN|nr:ORF7 [Passerine adenovirus 1]